jgi:hypothetical protein
MAGFWVALGGLLAVEAAMVEAGLGSTVTCGGFW